MINLYDIGRDDELHPALMKVGSYDVSRMITTDNDSLVDFIRHHLKMEQYDNEHMFMIALDRFDRALGVFLLGIGDFEECVISNRTVAEGLVLSGARQFMLIHNHPDGGLSLSEADKEMDNNMNHLADLFGVKYLGNFVATYDGFIISGMDKPIIYEDRWRRT